VEFLNGPDDLPKHGKDLIDDYLDGLLDEAGMRELEGLLRSDGRAREYFVRYARLHTHLRLEVRARGAGAHALEQIEALAEAPGKGRRAGLRVPRRLAIAACLLLTLAAGWRLRIERGLAEIHFQCGARVILEGPSVLEVISGKSARLAAGKLTARVPETGIGFEVLSPEGKVIDLGTEFGVLADKGSTEVYVFRGKVEAMPTAATGSGTAAVNLGERQAARIASGQVTVQPVLPEAAESRFVRTIAPPPVIVPRTLRLAFDKVVDKGVKDRAGRATRLTHRLPGTGKLLPERDGNLHLDPDRSQLELTTTNSDLNTQFQLGHGEYLGVRLADLGFTGKEDFAVTVTIPKIPALELVGQFGLYAGAASDRSIRGGLIGRKQTGQYMQFLVNNKDGCDTPDICQVGLLPEGTDLRLTLKHGGGKYSLAVENLTLGSASTLTIRHPDFLDLEKDLYVGLFGANTQSEVRKTLTFKDFQATVWAAEAAAAR
jgi:hypothetical protein